MKWSEVVPKKPGGFDPKLVSAVDYEMAMRKVRKLGKRPVAV